MKIEVVKILSAVQLNENEKELATKKAGKVFGSLMTPEFQVDKNILGGIILKSKNKVLDLSVEGKLNQIKKLIEEGEEE